MTLSAAIFPNHNSSMGLIKALRRAFSSNSSTDLRGLVGVVVLVRVGGGGGGGRMNGVVLALLVVVLVSVESGGGA